MKSIYAFTYIFPFYNLFYSLFSLPKGMRQKQPCVSQPHTYSNCCMFHRTFIIFVGIILTVCIIIFLLWLLFSCFIFSWANRSVHARHTFFDCFSSVVYSTYNKCMLRVCKIVHISIYKHFTLGQTVCLKAFLQWFIFIYYTRINNDMTILLHTSHCLDFFFVHSFYLHSISWCGTLFEIVCTKR